MHAVIGAAKACVISFYLSAHIEKLYTSGMKITHLNGLKAFEATLRCGNFRAAARELGVTPAAVGQQVRGLEEYLGRDLFLRTSKGVVPTAQARDIEAELTASLVGLSDVLAQLKTKKRALRLSLTMDASIADNWLAARLAQFHVLDTGAEIIIDVSEHVVDLTSEDFDFAIRFGPMPSDAYLSTPMFAGCTIPVCTADFASRYTLPRNPKTLRGVPLFHVKEETSDPAWLDWPGWCTLHGLDRSDIQHGLRFSRLSSGVQAARAGLGLALCGLTEAFSSLTDGSLVMPFAPQYNRPTSFEYRLVSLRGRRQTKVHRQFRDWIAEISQEFRVMAEALLSGRDQISPGPAAAPAGNSD